METRALPSSTRHNNAGLPTLGNEESRWGSKLDWEKVREIRRVSSLACRGCGEPPTNVQLARKFGISPPMVHKILTNKSWRIENDPAHRDPE
jgi:hypothetical protein